MLEYTVICFGLINGAFYSFYFITVMMIVDVGVYGLVDLKDFLGRDETIRDRKTSTKLRPMI